MITVKELIKMLKDEDPDAVVMLSCDAEGNFYSTLDNSFTVQTVKEVRDNGRDVYYNEEFNRLEDSVNTLTMYPRD